MAVASEANCSVLLNCDSLPNLTEADLQKKLENKDESIKIEGLKQIILCYLNGQKFPRMMMSVIKYCLHAENHLVKKLLLMYWEVVDKQDANGVLLHEMILVCNAMKNNLEHANEYIRGSTLRFLCNMKEPEVLESLIPPIMANLEHRHSYVRKNAVLAVYSVAASFPDLIPDAAELVDKFIAAESNPGAQRNAFLMLINQDKDRAISFLAGVISNITSLSEGFQLLTLELVRKICREQPASKSQFITCIFTLVNSESMAVSFEGANTLCALSSAPTAVRAAVAAYCSLLQKASDNNVKLVILQRLSNLKKRNEKILQELLMDIMKTLSSPNQEIRQATIELALELVSPRNVEDVVGLLKKELSNTKSPTAAAQKDNYRKLLVDAMHKCAIRFPDVVPNVVQLLMNFLGDESATNALDVIYFVREIVDEYKSLRATLLGRLLETFNEIKHPNVLRVALWILGEYAEDETIVSALTTMREAVGQLPLYKVAPATEGEGKKEVLAPAGPKYNADGSYATQSAATTTTVTEVAQVGSNFRVLILKGEWFVVTGLANAMTKLILRLHKRNAPCFNEENAKALLILVSALRLGGSTAVAKPMDQDALQRVMICIRVLMDPDTLGQGFADQTREAFEEWLKVNRASVTGEQPKKKKQVKSQCDAVVSIRQLLVGGTDDVFFDDADDLSRAIGAAAKKETTMNRVFQLTGFADPVYVEAKLTVLDYDIIMDILVVNQTEQVLRNVSMELCANGDLKLFEKPSPFNLAKNGVQRVTASVKVHSTESGVIFGNVVYDSASGTNQTVVVLNNIHMDIMDYIEPASCTDVKFRSMWAEFEWENKVAVNTDIEDVTEYLNHVAKITNMRCMTPESNMVGDCQFLAANLYARSIFGEDALLNLSVERQPSGRVGGYIRIRSKTQGIALSLGDKITAGQRHVAK